MQQAQRDETAAHCGAPRGTSLPPCIGGGSQAGVLKAWQAAEGGAMGKKSCMLREMGRGNTSLPALPAGMPYAMGLHAAPFAQPCAAPMHRCMRATDLQRLPHIVRQPQGHGLVQHNVHLGACRSE